MIDLNVPWTGAGDTAAWAESVHRGGWAAFASNVYYHCDKAGIREVAMQAQAKVAESSPAVEPFKVTTTIGKHCPADATFIRRATVVLHDGFQPNAFAKIADSRDYDVVAAMPTTQNTFQAACEILNCDLISMDYYCHFAPFKARRGWIMMALHRGCFFEVAMSTLHHVENGETETNKDNQMVSKAFRSNLAGVLNYIPLKRLVLSPGHTDMSNIVVPATFVGMCNELLSSATGEPCDALDCVTAAPRGCIAKGAARRTYGTGILAHRSEETLGKKFDVLMAT